MFEVMAPYSPLNPPVYARPKRPKLELRRAESNGKALHGSWGLCDSGLGLNAGLEPPVLGLGPDPSYLFRS